MVLPSRWENGNSRPSQGWSSRYLVQPTLRGGPQRGRADAVTPGGEAFARHAAKAEIVDALFKGYGVHERRQLPVEHRIGEPLRQRGGEAQRTARLHAPLQGKG